MPHSVPRGMQKREEKGIFAKRNVNTNRFYVVFPPLRAKAKVKRNRNVSMLTSIIQSISLTDKVKSALRAKHAKNIIS